MTRYADPTRCPDCGAHLPPDPAGCPSCGLPLLGPTATALFAALVSADRLLAQLRASALPVPVPAGAAGPPTPGADVSMPAVTTPTPGGPLPAAAPHAPARRGLSAASVPVILLGLGALCLLVAAVTFLVVAWSWLGVGGRTTILVALTLATGGLGVWLSRKGLRIAAESLTVVSFGLLALDVVGADNANWLGDLSNAGLTIAVGATLAGVALALALTTRGTLVGPQVIAGIGLWAVAAGTDATTTHTNLVATAAVVAFGALALLGRARALRVLPWVGLVGAAGWWLILAGSGLAEAADHASLRGLWIDGHAWPLVTATILLLAPAVVLRSRPWVARACGAGAAVLATVVAFVPAGDESATTMTVAALVAVVVWAIVLLTAPRSWAAVPTAPLLLSLVPTAAVAVGLAAQAAAAVLDTGDAYTRGAGVRVPDVEPVASAALLVPLVAGLLLAAVALARWKADPLRVARTYAVPLAAVLALGGVATAALYALPLAVVVAGLAVVAAGLIAAALARTDLAGEVLAAGAALLAVLAAAAALPSDWLVSGALLVLVAGAGLVLVRGRFPEALTGAELVAPPALAGLIWSVGEVGGLDPAYRAAPILLVLGALAVLRPHVPLEASGWSASVVAVAGSVQMSSDVSVSLALHLTLAGALVTTSSLVNASRRQLGWVGGLLLAMATWVRLADLGVHAPEAYTLPSALALVLVGLRHLRRNPGSPTTVALAPGLGLATVPSLLQVLVEDPVSWRALLLGLACLGLVLSGARLRWSAPLLIGAVVGALLVLRELAPYAGQTPQWVLIGLAGTLLTVVGITWESRLRDLHRAAAYLQRLR